MDAYQTITAANIWTTALSFSFFLCALLLFVIANQSRKAGNTYGAVSTGLCGVIVLFFAIVNNVWGIFPGGTLKGYPISAFFMWWFGSVAAIYFIYALHTWVIDKKEARQHPDDVDTYWTMFRARDKDLYHVDISPKREGVRKAFHLAGLLLLAAFYGIGFGPLTGIVNNATINHIYNEDPNGYIFLFGPQNLYPYGVNAIAAITDLTFFALLATLSFVIISDFIRVLWGTRYSIFNKLTGKVLRGKEYKAAGPQVYLIIGVCFSYFLYMLGVYPVSVPMAAALVACFSDALAALVGRRFGKRKVACPGGNIKTLEGFITGTGSAYLIALIFVGPILALVAAGIFFLLDYFPSPVADNLSNPILISIGMWAVSLLTGLPFGW